MDDDIKALSFLSRVKKPNRQKRAQIDNTEIDPSVIYWTVKELAKEAGCSRHGINYHITKGRIKVICKKNVIWWVTVLYSSR